MRCLIGGLLVVVGLLVPYVDGFVEAVRRDSSPLRSLCWLEDGTRRHQRLAIILTAVGLLVIGLPYWRGLCVGACLIWVGVGYVQMRALVRGEADWQYVRGVDRAVVWLAVLYGPFTQRIGGDWLAAVVK